MIKLFLQGVRLKTLPAVVIPICMATAWAYYKSQMFQEAYFFFTLLSGIFIQCAVNLFNDALDFQHGENEKTRRGPQRLTSSGLLSFSQVIKWALLCLCLSFVFGLPLIFRGGWPILLLGLVSFLFTYLYSGTSFRLSRQGLSEIFVVVFFGWGVVGGTYYIQTLQWDSSLIYLGLQCGFWSLSILLVNFLRDEKEDKKVGVKNSVTIYGKEIGVLFLGIVQMLIYLFCFHWLNLSLKSGALSFFLIPFSAALIYFVANATSSSRYNTLLFLMSVLYSAFGFLWVWGLFF